MNVLLAASLLLAQDPTFEKMKVEVESMRVENVPWKKIPWKTCLLEGLKESRKQKKPVIVWMFIDRPVDDPRC